MEKNNQKVGLISICIPCYNCELYLDETFKSLLNQSYDNLQIIIIDDNSTDNSLNIIKKYASKDNRILFEVAKNKGAAAARNQAYSLSIGDYIVFFDADDWIPPNFFSSQLQCIKTNLDVVVANWGRFHNNDINTLSIAQNQIKINLTFENWIINYWTNISHMTCPGRILMPKNLVEMSGLWDENLSLNDDFPFYTRIFSNCSVIAYNNESTFYYRSGINGLSALKTNKGYISLYNSLVIGISTAEKFFPNNLRVKLACANLLQNFIYECYPKEPILINKATSKIIQLGGAKLKFPSGGKTEILNTFFGWQLVKRIKNYIQ